jgi:hypothetical protein
MIFVSKRTLLFLVLLNLIQPLVLATDSILVEAENFDNHGGWVVDAQFIDQMGSPYLLAHGLGKPGDITLIPFYWTHHQRHSVYWQILPEERWNKQYPIK